MALAETSSPDTPLFSVINAALSYFGLPALRAHTLAPGDSQVMLTPFPVLREMLLEEVERSWRVHIGERMCIVVERVECSRFKPIHIYDVWEQPG